MKKVLIIGPEFYNYNLSIEKAFKNLGFETKVIGYFGGSVSSTRERIAFHLARNKTAFFEKLKAQFNRNVLALYNSFRPDMVFVIQANDLYSDTIDKMKESKRILWMMDSIFRYEGAYSLRNSFDHIFVFEKTDVDKLWETDKIKATFLPLAVDETIYFPTNKKHTIDILFVGALYESRMEMLRKLTQRFPGHNIKIYGMYYSPLRKPFYHLTRKDKHIFLNKNISPVLVNELYNQSKICLNMHHSQSKYGVNQRFFEVSGSRAFQLVDKNPFIEDNFSREEITTYDSFPDLLEKIEYYLDNQEESTAIAAKAFQRVIGSHTFTHRIEQVIKVSQAVKTDRTN